MPELPTITKSRSRLALATKHRDTAAATEARRDLAAAKIAQFIERTVAEAPPLTDDQRVSLARLLAGGASR